MSKEWQVQAPRVFVKSGYAGYGVHKVAELVMRERTNLAVALSLLMI